MFSDLGMEAQGTSLGGLQLPMALLDGVEASSSSSFSADNLLADLVPAIHKLAAKVRANAGAGANTSVSANTSVGTSANHGNSRGDARDDARGDFEQQLCGLVQHIEVRLCSYTSPLSPCVCYYPRTR